MTCPHHDSSCLSLTLSIWPWQKSLSPWESERRGMIGEKGAKTAKKDKILIDRNAGSQAREEEEQKRQQRKEGQVHPMKQNMRDKKKYERERGLEEMWGKHGWGGLKETKGGGVHHSVAMTGWYLHLPVICTGFCRVEEEGKRRRCKRGEEERENLYPLYLWASSPAVQEPAFQECLIFKSLISAPVLSIAVLYFYISFACSSSNLAPSIFFSFSFSLRCVPICVAVHEHPCTRE